VHLDRRQGRATLARVVHYLSDFTAVGQASTECAGMRILIAEADSIMLGTEPGINQERHP
jgi:hypothetical protein